MNKKLIFTHIFLFFSLLLIIECESETWFDEVTGYNENDHINGYAGSKGKSITAYYLCGNRHYRAHYIGDSSNSWTGEYSSCDPIGIGRKIDAISISGGKYYKVRYKNGKWETPVNGFDIFDSKNGYAGTLGKEIDAIMIEGNEVYRVAYGDESSNVEKASIRVIQKLFGITSTYEFNKERTIIDNSYGKVTVTLLHSVYFDYKGIINLVIKNHNIPDINIGDTNLIEEINKILNKNIPNISLNIKHSFSQGINHGDVEVKTYFWPDKKFEYTVGIKIAPNHFSYRGGFKIIFYLKDNNDFMNQKLALCVQPFYKRAPPLVKAGIDGILNAANGVIKFINNGIFFIIESIKNCLNEKAPQYGYFFSLVLVLFLTSLIAFA